MSTNFSIKVSILSKIFASKFPCNVPESFSRLGILIYWKHNWNFLIDESTRWYVFYWVFSGSENFTVKLNHCVVNNWKMNGFTFRYLLTCNFDSLSQKASWSFSIVACIFAFSFSCFVHIMFAWKKKKTEHLKKRDNYGIWYGKYFYFFSY